MDRSLRPAPDEFHEFYAGYVDTVPDGDIVRRLEAELDAGISFYDRIPEDLRDHRYADGKWSVREVLGHVVDTERIFAYRLMCIARGDRTPLPGMDQDEYMAGADFASRSWESLRAEYEHQRRADVALVSSLGADDFARRGTASGWEVSVRAVAWILAGHEMHHRHVLRERYLPS